MRQLYFLVPGTGGKYACGGLWAELKTLNLAKQICPAEVVTYRQREKGNLFLDDVVKQPNLETVIFVLSWGFDVAYLTAKLKSYNVIYHAHSAGYGFSLPPDIPILAVSRNTMGYWGQHTPNSLIYYLPNQISDQFCNLHLERDIDVLVQTRKTSEYVMRELVPALQNHCRVYLIDSYVDDLAMLFNRSKVYLYDSAEYWAQQKLSEGFGLPPMEALACGCQVFSSLNGALADYLDPGFNCYKIAVYSKEYDIQQILTALRTPLPALPESVLAEYRTDAIVQRLSRILDEMNTFFDYKLHNPSNIKSLTKWRLAQLNWQRLLAKVRRKFF
ncbi:glycosyltransferase [Kovacikia minuta CCNUW1]|uniref:glycosyltransferase n=1 Tax=Kovacikia minuta TaxID=2931930 RepID=UPI001CCF2ABA|nr:glycosyltransferase [Kovacikia minuta]UBF27753.1 glycosyltransferase [Kovacikia minuta CCNUW1]